MKNANQYATESLQLAYRKGYNHGHGIACHNVPELGANVWTESLGRLTVDAENVREVHADFCWHAEQSSRDFSPFEFIAHEFNAAGEESDELWNAFEQGAADAIADDLATYTDEDYGIVGK